MNKVKSFEELDQRLQGTRYNAKYEAPFINRFGPEALPNLLSKIKYIEKWSQNERERS